MPAWVGGPHRRTTHLRVRTLVVVISAVVNAENSTHFSTAENNDQKFDS
ncbi:MAG: hypothetical protein GY820_02100 [Gammaproteobacteria bacterium]|nr:hypothetical protein [Gammaproteobacteria bacterium]